MKMKVFYYFIFLSILILITYLVVKDRKGAKAERACKEINIGDKEEDVIRKMGVPKNIVYYYSDEFKKKLKVLEYAIPLLASSNNDVALDPDSNKVVYTVCNEP